MSNTTASNSCFTLHMICEKQTNVFCPRCGVVVPPNTRCIPSPSNPQVHYHPNCLADLARNLGRNVVWA